MTEVKQFDIVRWELELEELTILLAIRQTTNAIELPKDDPAIPEHGSNVAPVWREPCFIEMAAVLSKQLALFADGRSSGS